eukprot:TRINITY_DN1918_c0_g1_i2.p1 TRINITY_DN1918_c0_g1~~TRINITY_DN1918_c0_g1_i2.p1  ORF type:complete len:1052 (+),score=267.48 TRINITY_DN1918_c0_g1_i2:60-3158(+)
MSAPRVSSSAGDTFWAVLCGNGVFRVQEYQAGTAGRLVRLAKGETPARYRVITVHAPFIEVVASDNKQDVQDVYERLRRVTATACGGNRFFSAVLTQLTPEERRIRVCRTLAAIGTPVQLKEAQAAVRTALVPALTAGAEEGCVEGTRLLLEAVAEACVVAAARQSEQGQLLSCDAVGQGLVVTLPALLELAVRGARLCGDCAVSNSRQGVLLVGSRALEGADVVPRLRPFLDALSKAAASCKGLRPVEISKARLLTLDPPSISVALTKHHAVARLVRDAGQTLHEQQPFVEWLQERLLAELFGEQEDQADFVIVGDAPLVLAPPAKWYCDPCVAAREAVVAAARASAAGSQASAPVREELLSHILDWDVGCAPPPAALVATAVAAAAATGATNTDAWLLGGDSVCSGATPLPLADADESAVVQAVKRLAGVRPGLLLLTEVCFIQDRDQGDRFAVRGGDTAAAEMSRLAASGWRLGICADVSYYVCGLFRKAMRAVGLNVSVESHTELTKQLRRACDGSTELCDLPLPAATTAVWLVGSAAGRAGPEDEEELDAVSAEAVGSDQAESPVEAAQVVGAQAVAVGAQEEATEAVGEAAVKKGIDPVKGPEATDAAKEAVEVEVQEAMEAVKKAATKAEAKEAVEAEAQEAMEAVKKAVVKAGAKEVKGEVQAAEVREAMEAVKEAVEEVKKAEAKQAVEAEVQEAMDAVEEAVEQAKQAEAKQAQAKEEEAEAKEAGTAEETMDAAKEAVGEAEAKEVGTPKRVRVLRKSTVRKSPSIQRSRPRACVINTTRREEKWGLLSYSVLDRGAVAVVGVWSEGPFDSLLSLRADMLLLDAAAGADLVGVVRGAVDARGRYCAAVQPRRPPVVAVVVPTAGVSADLVSTLSEAGADAVALPVPKNSDASTAAALAECNAASVPCIALLDPSTDSDGFPMEAASLRLFHAVLARPAAAAGPCSVACGSAGVPFGVLLPGTGVVADAECAVRTSGCSLIGSPDPAVVHALADRFAPTSPRPPAAASLHRNALCRPAHSGR